MYRRFSSIGSKGSFGMEGAFLKKRTKKGKLLNYFGQKFTFFSYFFLLRPTKWVYFFLLYFCLGFSFTLFLFFDLKNGGIEAITYLCWRRSTRQRYRGID